jgi:hypothetical protein
MICLFTGSSIAISKFPIEFIICGIVTFILSLECNYFSFMKRVAGSKDAGVSANSAVSMLKENDKNGKDSHTCEEPYYHSVYGNITIESNHILAFYEAIVCKRF